MRTSPCPRSFPSFFSTVTPGQLPTYWLDPVRSLNMVVLPQLGFPARAMVMLIILLTPLSLLSKIVSYS